MGSFTASLGSASTALPFLVGGTDLTANLTISAPAGFEISSTGGAPFASSLDLAPVSGTVGSTSVYARLSASVPAGVNSGNITLASTEATSQQVAVSGTVTLPYEDWVAYWNTQTGSFSGATALGSADPDGDGYSNTTEFAFNGGTIWTGGNATGSGLNYQIEGTTNLLEGFQAIDVAVEMDSNQTQIPAADFPYVRWKFQAPITEDKDFYRVKAVPQGN